MNLLLAVSVSQVADAVFSLETVYVMTGLLLFVFAFVTARDPRHPRPYGSACFWAILGVIFVLGSRMPHSVTGLLVLALVVLDGLGRVKASGAPPAPPELLPEPMPARRPRPNRIFGPVLAIPIVTIAFALAFRLLGLDVNRGALVGLGFAGVVAMVVALRITGAPLRTLLDDGRRLNECMGTVNILPQLLASLGAVFTAAGVGQLIARGVVHVVPKDQLFLLVLANCLGMTLFTIAMGNSFAAFSVIATGVLVPLIVVPFGADPAMTAIITLTAGSSGTLLTPMAANFNIVPAALLEMKNPYGVIRHQLPFALVLWPAHVVLMWALVRWG